MMVVMLILLLSPMVEQPSSNSSKWSERHFFAKLSSSIFVACLAGARVLHWTLWVVQSKRSFFPIIKLRMDLWHIKAILTAFPCPASAKWIMSLPGIWPEPESLQIHVRRHWTTNHSRVTSCSWRVCNCFLCHLLSTILLLLLFCHQFAKPEKSLLIFINQCCYVQSMILLL